MKNRIFFAIALLMQVAACFALSDFDNKIAEFKNPSIDYRPAPLWFWNDTEIKIERVHEQMKAMKASNYGGMAIIPLAKRFAPEYLSEEYFKLYKDTAQCAKELGMRMSLYDEFGFPSGNAGGSPVTADGIPRFQNKYPEHTMKRLDKTETDCAAGSVANYTLSSKGKLMSLVAFDKESKETIVLSDHIRDGKIIWQVPSKGQWTIMEFRSVISGDNNVDYLSAESCSKFVEFVYEAYYSRMPEIFGDVLTTAFFDEPTLYRCDARAWTDSFNDKFIEKYHMNPSIMYPSIWYDVGEKTALHRNMMHTVRADMYAKGFMKVLNDWCLNHKIKLMGHQDNEERVNPVGTSADMMKCAKYLEIPGVDKISDPKNRPAEKFYKLISSSAYNWDKSLVMSESYGDIRDITIKEMYDIALDQYVKGINILIPHAVWYDMTAGRASMPPDLSPESPQYGKYLPEFNLFLSRLNLMMQNSARVYSEVAVLYPIETMQSQHYFDGPLSHYEGGVELKDANYIDVSVALFDAMGIDFTYLHPEVLDFNCGIDDGKIILKNEVQRNEFKVLILPNVKVISKSNLTKIKEFAEAGGAVLFIGGIPLQSADTEASDSEIGDMTRAILKMENILYLDKPEAKALAEFVKKHIDLSVKFEKFPLKNIRKIENGKSTYFIVNLNSQNYDGKITLAGSNFYEFNPHTGSVKKVENVNDIGGKTSFNLKLNSSRGVFFVEK